MGSDDELKEILPRGDDGQVLSIGTLLHDTEHDWICTFFHTKKGCQKGIRCRFCHHSGHKNPRRYANRNKGRREAKKMARQASSRPAPASSKRKRNDNDEGYSYYSDSA